MSRSDIERLHDVLAAVEAIRAHLARGPLDDGLVPDAVRARLMEIGEAVEDIDPALLAQEPRIPWRAVTGMRDALAHRYFDTVHAVVGNTVVGNTVRNDLPLRVGAVRRLVARPS